MRKKTKTVRAGILIVLTFFIFLFSLTLVLAFPGIPHQFYGSVTINNISASDNMKISAEIDGVEVASTLTNNGQYGYNPLFMIQDTDGILAGKTIVFYVEGFGAATHKFENGGSDELDLIINISEDCEDNDNDGFFVYDSLLCPGGNDCDDSSASIYPGAPEICGNEIDEDCNLEDLICPSPAPQGGGGGGGGGGSASYCGDGTCNTNEDCESCEKDCGECGNETEEIVIEGPGSPPETSETGEQTLGGSITGGVIGFIKKPVGIGIIIFVIIVIILALYFSLRKSKK